MAEPFAEALSKLADSGIGVAAAPSGGMGFALTADGKLPAGVLFTDTTAHKFAFGVASIFYPGGSPRSDITTFDHSLGIVPLAVWLTGRDGGTNVVAYAVEGWSSTQITVRGEDVSGTNRGPGSLDLYWLAIG